MSSIGPMTSGASFVAPKPVTPQAPPAPPQPQVAPPKDADGDNDGTSRVNIKA